MSATDELSGFFERFGSAYRWFVITTTLMGTITVVLSSTIVNVALPDIMGAFGIGQDQAQWMSTGFLAAMTASMLVNAWLNDAIGIRATFVGSMALFAAASVLGGLAPNENVLTFARVAQGIAAGIIQPLAMIMIFRVFPPEERGTAMGIYGIGVVLAPAVGPVLGGWLIDNYDWRYVFYMGLPTSFLGMLLGTIFLPTRLSGGKRRRFDSFGFVLLAAFLVTSLYALANGQREGWNSDIIVGTGALSLALFLSFIVWLARRAEPLVSLRVFAFRRYSAASLVAFLYGAGLYGSTYLIPLFLQTVQGYTPTRSGL
ncbi:MAG: DHA2 family efflux MFS transporter permease subunit, partial [Tepidiphilus sp.]